MSYILISVKTPYIECLSSNYFLQDELLKVGRKNRCRSRRKRQLIPFSNGALMVLSLGITWLQPALRPTLAFNCVPDHRTRCDRSTSSVTASSLASLAPSSPATTDTTQDKPLFIPPSAPKDVLSAVSFFASTSQTAISSSTLTTSFSSSNVEAVSHRTGSDLRRRQLIFSMLGTVAAYSSIKKSYADSTALRSTAISNVTLSERNDVLAFNMTDVLRPPLDDREYLAFTLENGLRVLIASDPTSNQAAAAMDVHVGATSDPDNIPGLAHFTEHMLFLGTKPYPQEDSFESFLASNGGSSNAYTDSENTVYFFDLQAADADNKFKEGLLRFGSFFSAPLFSESATDRELNAIESENAKNLQSDIFRFFQLQKSRAQFDHPFHKFYTGNKKTLLENTKAQGIDLRQELIKFYKTYYSANQMTLAVIGPQSIATLKQMVNNAFGTIPNRHTPAPETAWKNIKPFSNDNSLIPSFLHILEIVPVQDIRQVTLTWPIIYDSEQDKLDSLLIKPSNYVAHLLGHEGPRSLLSYLKRQGWANSVAADSEERLSDFETFQVVVGLTTNGLAALNNVIQAIFSFITLLHDRRIPTYVFEETLQLDELQWRFTSKGNVGQFAQTLSTAMQNYPPALYVAGPRRLAVDNIAYGDVPLSSDPRASFSSKEQQDRTRSRVERYINNLTTDNLMVTVLSQSFKGQTQFQELWYGTDYSVRPISASTLESWRKPPPANKLKMNYPSPNIFIPSESGLVVKKKKMSSDKSQKRTFEARMTPIPPPRIIRDDGSFGRWTVHFKQDDTFGQPMAYVLFEILNKDIFSSPELAALSNLFEISVSDRLGEYAYDASLAGLVYDFKVLPRGVRMTFGGYNDKLKNFASYISKKLSKNLADVLPKNEHEFDRYKDEIMRALSAFDVKQPYAHASYYSQLTTQPHRFQYSNKELRDATRKMTLPDLVKYANTIWSSGKGEALVQGNVDEDEALRLVESIGDAIPFRPIPESEYPPRLVALPLPKSKATSSPARLLIAEPNPYNENSVSLVLLQSLGATEQDHVLIELLSSILQEPFYNELRTKRQLGYIVSSGLRGVGESRTLSFIVQSSIATADRLTIEIINFLNNVKSNILEKLPRGDLAVYVKSLIDRKTEPDKDLITEVTRNWGEIASGRLQFDRIQKEAAALLEVEKEDLLSFWNKIYAEDGRRILITEIIPRNGAASSELPPLSTGYSTNTLVSEGLVLGENDIEQFRRDRDSLIYEI